MRTTVRRHAALLLPAAILALSLGCGKPKLTYTGLKLVRPEIARVSDADVSNAMKQLRSNFAPSTPLSPGAAARSGHRVVIDFVGTIGGTPFQGGSQSGFPLVLGAEQMIPGFEEGLIGMKPGETRDIEATFPRNYHEANLAGRTAVFRTTLRLVESLRLPPLDADLARRASGGRLATVEELKRATREQIHQARLSQADRSLKMQAAEMLIAQWDREPGQREVDQALDQIVQQQLQAASRQGGGPPPSIPDVEAIRRTYGETVVKNLKLSKVLASIAKWENLSVTDQEVEQAAARIAQGRGQDPGQFTEELRRTKQLDNLRDRLIEERAMSFVLQGAEIEEAKQP